MPPAWQSGKTSSRTWHILPLNSFRRAIVDMAIRSQAKLKRAPSEKCARPLKFGAGGDDNLVYVAMYFMSCEIFCLNTCMILYHPPLHAPRKH